jgi:hypothetical protein
MTFPSARKDDRLLRREVGAALERNEDMIIKDAGVLRTGARAITPLVRNQCCGTALARHRQSLHLRQSAAGR